MTKVQSLYFLKTNHNTKITYNFKYLKYINQRPFIGDGPILKFSLNEMVIFANA